jgi:Mlc titration factor MtfA (ptsG expression regulator)
MITPLVAILIMVAVIAFITLYKKPRRRFDLPGGYKKMLEDHVVFYRTLEEPAKTKFEEKLKDFLGYISITGVDTEVDDLDKLLVASSAVIPIFGFPAWRYNNLSEVLLYKDRFNADNYSASGSDRDVLGMVGNGAMQMQMNLSKPDLYRGFGVSGGTENTGIHEFVHLLDKEDGEVDGMPEALLNKAYAIPWLKMMAENIAAMKAGKSDINIYSTKNNAEFFAVASEYFFEKPKQFKEKHPELYDMLSNIFGQQP